MRGKKYMWMRVRKMNILQDDKDDFGDNEFNDLDEDDQDWTHEVPSHTFMLENNDATQVSSNQESTTLSDFEEGQYIESLVNSEAQFVLRQNEIIERLKREIGGWTPTWHEDDPFNIFSVANGIDTFKVNLQRHYRLS